MKAAIDTGRPAANTPRGNVAKGEKLQKVTNGSYAFIVAALMNENIVTVSIFSKRSLLKVQTKNFRTH